MTIANVSNTGNQLLPHDVAEEVAYAQKPYIDVAHVAMENAQRVEDRMIAGEPMLAAALVGAVVAGLYLVIRLPLLLSAIFWLFVSLAIAFVLTLAPTSHLGIASW